jgi:hypothetical protein
MYWIVPAPETYQPHGIYYFAVALTQKIKTAEFITFKVYTYYASVVWVLSTENATF